MLESFRCHRDEEEDGQWEAPMIREKINKI